MPLNAEQKYNLAFQSLIKEAEFLRSETLLCIEKVRQVTIYSTSIAGFALPILASLAVTKDGTAQLNSIGNVFQAIEKNHVIIQFICITISLTCTAFLSIYLGIFKQIFTFAKYFREHLIPSINTVVEADKVRLFYWEEWLQNNRRKKSLFIGDNDLSAEPILIGIYVVFYTACFLVIAIKFSSFPITSYILATVIASAIIYIGINFLHTLRSSAKS